MTANVKYTISFDRGRTAAIHYLLEPESNMLKGRGRLAVKAFSHTKNLILESDHILKDLNQASLVNRDIAQSFRGSR